MSDERPVSPAPLNHYLQNALSPRSRSEYDNFNRFHFSQLRHLRDRRAVTPKVGGGQGGGSPGAAGTVRNTLSQLPALGVAAQAVPLVPAPAYACG
jgi:hypothetical protein